MNDAIIARTKDAFGHILILDSEGSQEAYRATSNAVSDFGVADIKPGNKLGLEPGKYHWVRID